MRSISEIKNQSMWLKTYQLRHLCFSSKDIIYNFRDPPGICKRSVSEISWHTENPSKLAASYAINRFQQTPAKMKTESYIWDLANPNEPEITLESPSPVTNISFNHKLTDIVGGGCANGIVAVWDSRKGKEPVALSHV